MLLSTSDIDEQDHGKHDADLAPGRDCEGPHDTARALDPVREHDDEVKDDHQPKDAEARHGLLAGSDPGATSSHLEPPG